MTIAPSRSLTDQSIAERRRAALERLHAGKPPAPSTRRWFGSPGEPIRKVRVATRAAAQPETLGPSSGVYYIIMVTLCVFVMLGLVMVLSATSVNQVAAGGSPYDIFTHQLMWAFIGLVGILAVLRVSYARWRTLVIPGAVIAGALMLLPFAPGIGITINDARSWIHVGGFSFQPSELLKLASIAFLADYYARNEHRVHLTRYGIIPLAIVAGVSSGICFLQGDLGSAMVLGAVAIAVGLIAGIPLVHIGSLAASGVVAVSIAILSDPRRFNRLVAFRDIEGNKDHLAWQTWQSLLSISHGGITGSGIGGSNSKLGYLPLAHSDFIFAVIADELGLVGVLAVVGGFLAMVYCGMQVALAAPDRFGMLLAGGISAWFGVQAIVHMGGVVGLMPVTGLTLPFFSAGGSSLLVSMLAAGLLLNVARRVVTDTRAPRQRRRLWSPRVWTRG